MGFRINTNTLSLMAQRNLSKTTKAFAKSLERLSSGSRINRAGDDAAGLAIATSLESQVRGVRQVVRNLNDAQGFLSVAEGALSTQASIAQRMRELALQAANGALGNTQRSFLDNELQQLIQEFNRIKDQTEFNGTKLLDGSFSSLSLQVGTERNQSLELSLESISIDNTIQAEPFVGADGSFQDPVAFSESDGEIGADVNGDGILDLIGVSNDQVFVRFGNGDGSLSSKFSFSSSQEARVIDIGDFNNDGINDILHGGGSDDNPRTFISAGSADGSFTGFLSMAFSISGRTGVGDFNGDGNEDFFELQSDSDLRVFLSQGDGSMIISTSFSTGLAFPASIAKPVVADLNNDNILDIATSDGTQVTIAFGNGNGSFQSITTFASEGLDPLNAGDVDGDGDIDLIGSEVAFSGNIGVFLNNGDGSFQAATTQASPSSNIALVRDVFDFNSDGILDLVLGANAIAAFGPDIALGNGDGSFQTAIEVGTNSVLGVGDINGDGVADIMGDGESYFANTATFTPEFETPLDISTQENAQNFLAVADNLQEDINTLRASIGAQQNRLESASRNSSIMLENLSSARSQIMDADIAEETAELTRAQILQQASVAVLSQANVSLQITLELLRF